MPSSGKWLLVVLVRNDVSENPVTLIFRVHLEGGGDTFLRNSVPTKPKLCHISEDGIFHSRRRKNVKTYIALTGWSL
jgi:hypothetical protein